MDGVGPLGTPRRLRGYGWKQHPYAGHPLLHPCEAGVLGFKASVPCARDPEAPAIQSQSPAPLSTQSPTHGASNVPPFPGPPPGPAQALSQPGCLAPFLSHHPGIDPEREDLGSRPRAEWSPSQAHSPPAASTCSWPPAPSVNPIWSQLTGEFPYPQACVCCQLGGKVITS